MGQFIVQMLFEAYMHLMPPRVVLWTLAAMLVAFPRLRRGPLLWSHWETSAAVCRARILERPI